MEQVWPRPAVAPNGDFPHAAQWSQGASAASMSRQPFGSRDALPDLPPLDDEERRHHVDAEALAELGPQVDRDADEVERVVVLPPLQHLRDERLRPAALPGDGRVEEDQAGSLGLREARRSGERRFVHGRPYTRLYTHRNAAPPGRYLIGSWTSRRVDTPASRLSPAFRARTNITRSPRRSGMFRVGWIWIVAQPVESVVVSGEP